MGSQRIKKKSANSSPTSMMPRQGAIPCLILIFLIVVGLAVLLFFTFRSAG
jgi:hypothetical protein